MTHPVEEAYWHPVLHRRSHDCERFVNKCPMPPVHQGPAEGVHTWEHGDAAERGPSPRGTHPVIETLNRSAVSSAAAVRRLQALQYQAFPPPQALRFHLMQSVTGMSRR
jgi:hypothetical protein